jgi:hypothetical protein
MFWELVLAVLAGCTVLPALVWALANEIMRVRPAMGSPASAITQRILLLNQTLFR